MKKRLLYIVSFLLIIFEIIGIVLNYRDVGTFGIDYYTEDSNILALFTALVYVGYLYQGKVPKWVNNLKFISTVALTVTFIVVLIVLGPATNYDYKTLLFSDAMLYHHTLCPLLAMFSTIFLEEHKINDFKGYFMGACTTLIYGIIMLILNLLRLYEGPYFFLMVYDQGVLTSVIWFVIIIGGSILISYVLSLMNKKWRLKS